MSENIVRVSTAAHTKRGFEKKETGRIPTAARSKRGRLRRNAKCGSREKRLSHFHHIRQYSQIRRWILTFFPYHAFSFRLAFISHAISPEPFLFLQKLGSPPRSGLYFRTRNKPVYFLPNPNPTISTKSPDNIAAALSPISVIFLLFEFPDVRFYQDLFAFP